MNIILLSGGSGKRLWPLSNDIRSKQFIKIFRKENGEYESMVQRVYRQIKAVDRDATVTVATSKSQVSALHNQLGGGVSICVEPYRRDTFPAIALAAAYLVDVMHADPSESVVVCPVDPYVEDSYFASAQLSRQQARDQAIAVLQNVVSNSTDEVSREQANADISRIASEIQTEAAIETLIKSKGFEECVAVISEGSASVIVRSDGLLPNELSQIKEIVWEQAGIDPLNIKIIEKKSA